MHPSSNEKATIEYPDCQSSKREPEEDTSTYTKKKLSNIESNLSKLIYVMSKTPQNQADMEVQRRAVLVFKIITSTNKETISIQKEIPCEEQMSLDFVGSEDTDRKSPLVKLKVDTH